MWPLRNEIGSLLNWFGGVRWAARSIAGREKRKVVFPVSEAGDRIGPFQPCSKRLNAKSFVHSQRSDVDRRRGGRDRKLVGQSRNASEGLCQLKNCRTLFWIEADADLLPWLDPIR